MSYLGDWKDWEEKNQAADAASHERDAEHARKFLAATGSADDFKDALDPGKDKAPYKGPVYWLWVFNPMDASVHIVHNEGVRPAMHATHKDIAPEANHPGRLEGYAFKIKGGYRFMTVDAKTVDDPFITEKIKKALDAQEG